MFTISSKERRVLLVLVSLIILGLSIQYLKETAFLSFPSYAFYGGSPKERDKVNVNTASLEELITLPGVGGKIALRIINERRNAPFEKKEDLLRVKGIGEKKLAEIGKYVEF